MFGGASTIVARKGYSTWVEIDAVLSPLIGARDMAGLYRRSLMLTLSAHPLLRVVYEAPPAVSDYTTLRDLLMLQPIPIAVATDEALLESFKGLLSQLVGPSVTERVLRLAIDNISSHSADAKDRSQ